MEEVWILVDGFPNYAVSNYGEVKNITTGQLLKPRPLSSGYLRVMLYLGTTRKDAKEFYIHRLVARAFFQNYREKLYIRHVDGDKTNNRVNNLMSQDGMNRLKSKVIPKRVTTHGKQVRIIELDMVFANARYAARFINGDHSSVYSCLKGRRKTHHGYTFEFVEDDW